MGVEGSAERLPVLSVLLRERNRIEREIAALIGRPAHSGHVAEYIAAQVFGIELHESASTKGIDGRFRSGPCGGATVNVKFKSRNDGLLDINLAGLPDYFLVLAGPWAAAASSRGAMAPFVITHVCLFETRLLLGRLRSRSVKIGTATSVARSIWEEAEVYPLGRNQRLALTASQQDQLRLFSDTTEPRAG